MFRFWNALLILLLVAGGLGLSTPVRADSIEPDDSNIDPLSMLLLNLPRLPKLKQDYEFKSKDQKFLEKRQEINYLLQKVRDLIDEKNYGKALKKLQALDELDGKNAEETFLVHRMRVAAASGAGDDPTLIKSLEAVIATNQLPVEDQLQFIHALANLYYKQKNYPKTIAWATRYIGEGGTDAYMRFRRTRAYYLNNEFVQAANEIRAEIETDEAEGKTPTRAQMSLFTSSEFKSGNRSAFIDAIEKSVTYYPVKEDWAELLSNVMSKPAFNDGLVLDVYRFMYKTNQFDTASDFTDMAQLTMQAGFAAEAKQILSEGFKSGILGKGPDIAFQKRLLDVASFRLVARSKTLAKDEADMIAAKEGGGLVHLGYMYVTDGQFDKGIGLMELGIQIGGMKRPEIAKLHLGIAKALAGRNSDAIRSLKSVQGEDGTADLARYWVIYLTGSLSR